MKKIRRFQPHLVTKHFFKGFTPSAINTGHCFEWAYLTYRVFHGTELWDMGSHAFIKYGVKFFDSERLNGVLDWRDLPATNCGQGCGCEFCQKPAHREYVPQFKARWRGMQHRFQVVWEDLDDQAEIFLKKFGNYHSLG